MLTTTAKQPSLGQLWFELFEHPILTGRQDLVITVLWQDLRSRSTNQVCETVNHAFAMSVGLRSPAWHAGQDSRNGD